MTNEMNREKKGEKSFAQWVYLSFINPYCGIKPKKTVIFAQLYTLLHHKKMKDFIKFALATVAGLMITGGLFFVLSIIVLSGIIAASSEQEVQVRPNTVLSLKLDKAIEERATKDPLSMLMGEEHASMGLNDMLNAIKKAKENEHIRGIYIEAGHYMDFSMATLEELRRALLDFKESNKFIIAYGDNYTQKEYYLCSVADKVILNPQGTIEWVGLSSSPMFFKKLLDKADIEVQIFKVGTYKSAVEPFITTEMSPASREQTDAYLKSIWSRMTEDVATSRKLDTEKLNEYADQMLSMSASEEFIKAGLADTLAYKEGARAYLKRMMGLEQSQSIQALSINEMAQVKSATDLHKKGKETIAVYYAVGDITDNAMAAMGTSKGIDGNKTIKELDRLCEDENVKAVVLRVNSPGGSAFASEQIWHEVVKIKAKKPVIVSMGNYAASGGYYISCAADSIFAEATTLTGSIGIFGLLPNLEGFLSNKLGVNFDVVNTNQHSDMGMPMRPLSETEKAIMQKNVERGYALFVKRCADGRGMSEEAIRKIAEGRVWTGSMAKELGLVDEIGGINEAIKAASEKAHITEYTIKYYPEETDPFTSLLQTGKDNYIKNQLKQSTGEYYNYLQIINRLKHAHPIQAHMGYYPNL